MDEQIPPLANDPSGDRYSDNPPPAWPADQGVAPAPVAARRGRWSRVAIGLGLAAGTAVGAAAISAAATGSDTPSASTAASSSSGSSGSTQTAPDPGPGGHMFGGPGFGIGGPGVLHGQFTVNGPNGYEDLQEQEGTVSSISDTSGSTWSVTVTSADGKAYTYVVDSSTSVNGGESGISSVAKGDTVHVLAVVSNGTATAKDLTDATVLKNNGQSWMPQPPQPPSGSSSSSSSSSSTSA
ncbi:MAG: hypothetical protein ACYDA2_07440 [Acidimicrobiales bacterium]